MAATRLMKLLCPTARLSTVSSNISRHASVSSQAATNLDSSDTHEEPILPKPAVEEVLDESLTHADFFGVQKLVSVKDLFDARVHFGHKSGCRNDLMAPYLFGERLQVDVFDLDQTLSLLHSALNFTAHIAYRGGIILFLSRNKQNIPLIERTAVESGEYSHCRSWIKGTFMNARVQLGPTVRLPDLCIFMNSLDTIFEQHGGVTECARLLVPTVGIMDSNCDPRLISYPVPGNDDTPCSVALYCELFKEAILLGKKKRAEITEDSK